MPGVQGVIHSFIQAFGEVASRRRARLLNHVPRIERATTARARCNVKMFVACMCMCVCVCEDANELVPI